MASLPPALDASERFDKQALLQIHDLLRHHLENIPAAIFQTHLSFTDPIASSGAASSTVPLERLDPISLTQLQVGQVHRGRVLYGILCAEAFSLSYILTMLEDDNGLAVRLAIYNVVADSQTNIKRLYPSGAKLAIRDPHFKRARNGSLAIRIDNPDNVEMNVTQKEKCTESLPRVDVQELRKKGNSCYREKEWDAAVENYTKCINAALLRVKKRKRPSNDKNNLITCLMQAYSGRAEIRLQVNEFELALEDSNEALEIDSGNFYALHRKGRALFGLRQYAAACEYLEKASNACPVYKKIQDVLRQAKVLHAQSRDGIYDISDSLLRRGTPPEVADFLGPVEIKMTEDGRGRGLYATREISAGQLLLVSNAVAVAYEDNERSVRWGQRGNINLPPQVLVDAVVSAATKSQRLLQQLYSLEDYFDVPTMDLFKTEGQMSPSQAAGKEKLQVDVNRVWPIISRNAFGGAEQTFLSKSKIYEDKLVQRDQKFSGLWLLPSFFNHSCLPNSSRVMVGSAMFIHASRPIKQGEEITISYFDTLVPVLQRQVMCKNWCFKCKCRRCILEFSLKTVLDPITSGFEQLHDKALQETNVARSQQDFDRNLPICAEFAKIFDEVEEIIKNSALLNSEVERNWIRGSFVSAYLAGIQSNGFFPTTLTGCVPSVEEVMKAIQNTVPGDMRTLVTAARLLKEANPIMEDESRDASELANDACTRVFGRHSDEAIKELVLKHSNCHFF